MSTISLQNTSANNKNKLTSKGEDSGSVLQPVLVPQLGYSAIQNVLLIYIQFIIYRYLNEKKKKIKD